MSLATIRRVSFLYLHWFVIGDALWLIIGLGGDVGCCPAETCLSVCHIFADCVSPLGLCKVCVCIVHTHTHAHGCTCHGVRQEWRSWCEVKGAFYRCLAHYYMGQHAEEQQKWGERLTYFTSADSKLSETIKCAKVIICACVCWR